MSQHYHDNGYWQDYHPHALVSIMSMHEESNGNMFLLAPQENYY